MSDRAASVLRAPCLGEADGGAEKDGEAAASQPCAAAPSADHDDPRRPQSPQCGLVVATEDGADLVEASLGAAPRGDLPSPRRCEAQEATGQLVAGSEGGADLADAPCAVSAGSEAAGSPAARWPGQRSVEEGEVADGAEEGAVADGASEEAAPSTSVLAPDVLGGESGEGRGEAVGLEKDPVPDARTLGDPHIQRMCRPCLFVSRPGGCNGGDACAFCHAHPTKRVRARPPRQERLRCKEQLRSMLDAGHDPEGGGISRRGPRCTCKA